MGSARIQNLLDRTATDGGGAATDSGDAIANPKNSAKTALNYLFELWHDWNE